jgi:type I restriction enzyme S subunit
MAEGILACAEDLRSEPADRPTLREWVETSLDKISTNLDSRRIPITKNVRQSGEYPYYGASGIVDYVADYIFEGNNLLVSEDGANLLARSSPIAFSVSGKY